MTSRTALDEPPIVDADFDGHEGRKVDLGAFAPDEQALLQDAWRAQPTRAHTDSGARNGTGPQGDVASGWEPVDVPAVLADDVTALAEATVLRRSDGVGLLYAGRVNGLAGEAESLKSWLALVACVQELDDERHVLYIDLEDNPRSVIRDRLHRTLGVGAARLATFFHYIRPDEPITAGDARARLFSAVAVWSPSLVILDGVTEALQLHGLASSSDVDYATLAALLQRPLADLGPAVWPLDHVVKDKEQRGRGPTGTQHKLAAVSGAAYGMRRVRPARRGVEDGLSCVVVAKDRPGGVRPHTNAAGVIADFHFGSTAGGSARWRLEPPRAREEVEEFRPTSLMERVSRHLEGAPIEQSQAAILKAVPGQDTHLAAALRCLVAEGFASTADGPRGATLHRSERPFRDAG